MRVPQGTAAARNVAINFHRDQRPTVPFDFLPPALEPSNDDPNGCRLETAETLQALFARLDADSRDLLLLRFAAQLSLREIAAVIGKSEAASRMRLVRTLRTLKESYDEQS